MLTQLVRLRQLEHLISTLLVAHPQAECPLLSVLHAVDATLGVERSDLGEKQKAKEVSRASNECKKLQLMVKNRNYFAISAI